LEFTDTLFYNLGQLRVQQYQFEFIPNQLSQPGLGAYLEDKYLHTSTAVSLLDTTRLMFNIINVPGSYATDRFRLVFRQLKNVAKDAGIIADNKTGKTVDAVLTGLDRNADKAEQLANNSITGIYVYPNPVENKTLQIQFSNQVKGNYNINLSSNSGQIVYHGNIQLASGEIVKTIKLDQSIAAGIYQLSVESSGSIKTTQQVIIK
jgi:hypothetical protein